MVLRKHSFSKNGWIHLGLTFTDKARQNVTKYPWCRVIAKKLVTVVSEIQNGRLTIKRSNSSGINGLAKMFIRVFRKILRKNPKEIFGQSSTIKYVRALLSNMIATGCRG